MEGMDQGNFGFALHEKDLSVGTTVVDSVSGENLDRRDQDPGWSHNHGWVLEGRLDVTTAAW